MLCSEALHPVIVERPSGMIRLNCIESKSSLPRTALHRNVVGKQNDGIDDAGGGQHWSLPGIGGCIHTARDLLTSLSTLFGRS